jgi:hypothetical protein
MRRFLPTFLVITLILAIYPFIGKDRQKAPVTGLPWQIEVLPDGATRVFGVVPGHTTLGEAAGHLGDDMELAVMVAKGEPGSLEMYYGQYRAGLMSAKLVLAAEMDAATIDSMQQNAADTEILKSGVRKYVLSEQDYAPAFNAVVTSIAFIPAVNLDHEIITKRFGEADEVIRSGDGISHYLYPAKGLDVILSEEGKEVLQYVAPGEFERLRGPLGQQSG